MQRHRHLDLYKDSFRSPRNYKETLREQKIEARAKQHDAHRLISVSPTPQRSPISQDVAQFEERLASTPLPPKAKNKENVGDSIDNKIKQEKEKENCVVFTASQIAQVACAPNGTSLNRKEAYLKRFLEWRNKKKQEEVKKKEVRDNVWKPVGPLTTCGANVARAAYASFEPKNCKFPTPAGVKQLETTAKTTKQKEEGEQKRESFYKFICTPEKKISKDQPANSLARKVMQQAVTMKKEGLVTISHVKPSSKAIINKKPKESQVEEKPPSIPKMINNKPTAVPLSVNKTNKPPLSSKQPSSSKLQLSSKPPSSQQPLAKPKNVGTTEGFIKPEVKAPLVASSVHHPNGISKNANAHKAPAATTSTTTNRAGAIGKAKVAQKKRIGSKSAVNNHKNMKLGTNMKANKRTNVNGGSTTNIKKGTAVNEFKQTKLDKKVQKFWALKQTIAAKTVTETSAKCGKPQKLNEKIKKSVTSTQQKCEHVDDDFVIDSDISPIENSNSLNVVAPKESSHTSSIAKRAILLPKSKFNFVRYSVPNKNEVESPMPVELDQLMDDGNDATNNKPKPVNAISLIEDDTLVNDNATKADLCTPPQPPVGVDNDERPANYLSPFVSVSRGKVNLKSERDRRNSMYLANDETPKKSSDSKVTTTPQTPIEVRRTLESVRYFRQQLQDETTRLRDKCVAWEFYKIQNLIMLQQLNCDDKIDATVGQTLLLTGNKFEQFKRLITRCEAGATGIGAVADNGSEDTKLVSAVDLEGFWAILGLQIENVEKRFAEIERWKTNNWQDPDLCTSTVAAAAKSKSKIIKIKQPKTAAATKPKASSGILELMRKKHAELRKMKSVTEAASDSYSRSTNKVGTPKRRSIVVPNCKQFSPAATVLSISNGKRRSSIGPKGIRNETTWSGDGTNFDLRKTAILCAKKTKVASTPPRPQPATMSSSPQFRKSILKTPGTSKSARKSVVFSSKKLVRRFQFTFEDPTLSDDDEQQHYQVKNEEEVNIINEYEDTTADMISSEQSCSGDFYNFKMESGQRTPARCYTLRNRRVKLRPSSEIIIPQ